MQARIELYSCLFLCSMFILSGCYPNAPNADPTNRTITTAELEQWMASNDDYILVDVRTDEEVADGMIPGSLHFDINRPDFNETITALEKGPIIIVYCKSGGRAERACDQLEEAGYPIVKNYGGYNRWIKERSK